MLSCVSTPVGTWGWASGVEVAGEQFVDGEEFAAVPARAACAQAAGGPGAVVAPLLREVAGAALVAGVDGVLPA